MSLPRYRILLAEDHSIVREGIKLLLSLEADFEIVGEADNGVSAVALAKDLQVDAVLLDLDMPQLSGSEAALAIKRDNHHIKIIILTGSLDVGSVNTSLAAGADGYVLKREDSSELLRALRAVLAGGHYISRAIAEAFEPPPIDSSRQAALAHGAGAASGQKKLPGANYGVTLRELEILQFIARGSDNRNIAAQLNVSFATVRKHRENLMRKLNLHNTAELTAYAIKRGLY